uniref:I-set domain-containing protein n=1 Tax=Caenorhabditis japonica TaxID=281687 RepID=A0A8R1IJL5_CAEJA
MPDKSYQLCAIFTSRKKTFHISRDGALVRNSSEYSQSFNGSIAKLQVNNLSEEKSGLYKCHAKCEYGEGQSSAMVKVDQSGN